MAQTMCLALFVPVCAAAALLVPSRERYCLNKTEIVSRDTKKVKGKKMIPYGPNDASGVVWARFCHRCPPRALKRQI